METMTYCPKCRGLRVSWNKRYVVHCLTCLEVVSRSAKLLIVTVILSSVIFAFPVSTGVPFTEFDTTVFAGSMASVPPAVVTEAVTAADPAATPIERLLAQYGVDGHQRHRIALAIVDSSKQYHLDPRLIASIVIVESRANPFAISDSSSVGIMQIHLPTWGQTADEQNINLFKVEDNIAFGARILRGYVSRFGLWAGVMRYKGWTDGAESQQKADEYVLKVKRIFQPRLASGSQPDAVLAAGSGE